MLSAEIDTLSLVHKQTKVINLYEILVESSVRNLRLLESILTKKLENGEDLSLPKVYHFLPEHLGHFITRYYMSNDNDKVLSEFSITVIKMKRRNYFILGFERENLHKQFSLPLNRPVFRRSNRYIFKDEMQTDITLINPHEGINPTQNGKQFFFY